MRTYVIRHKGQFLGPAKAFVDSLTDAIKTPNYDRAESLSRKHGGSVVSIWADKGATDKYDVEIIVSSAGLRMVNTSFDVRRKADPARIMRAMDAFWAVMSREEDKEAKREIKKKCGFAHRYGEHVTNGNLTSLLTGK